ncbi:MULTISPECIES: hypothetical protein [Dickeya]|uniref:hypothetical protein n=1 Tax=Dickeya TaxID=204037 RepID=UPI0006ACA6FB|nr:MULTISPECIES: hypothetical protein [Dickeya]MBO8133100.1 hypothetical protein [Dickeya fangzhongdai]ULR31852.1 hypothetical protein MJO48_03885 [Dickeya fangzhongdai]
MKVVFNVNGKKVPLKSLQYISKANQLEVMRNWFFENFEDPANSCPYETREGGYAYIYGGPYEASEELQAMFEGYVKFGYIQELVNELQEQCYEWSGNSNNIDDWYDEDLYDAVTSSEKPFFKFVENIDGIKSLAKGEYTNEQEDRLLSILYTNVITALETLYVELFINSIDKDESYIADFIEKGKTEFKVSKEIVALPFKGEPIEKIREELIKAIKEHLISASWHNTNQVVKRYKATYDINVQKDWPIDAIEIATLKRNHLVHRGGKDKDGNPVVITEQDLEQLLDQAMSLGKKLYDSLDNAMQKKTVWPSENFKQEEPLSSPH